MSTTTTGQTAKDGAEIAQDARPNTSLRFRLPSVWALSLVGCIAVGMLLVQLYRQSTTAGMVAAPAKGEAQAQ